jgi:hypothetical protein
LRTENIYQKSVLRFLRTMVKFSNWLFSFFQGVVSFKTLRASSYHLPFLIAAQHGWRPHPSGFLFSHPCLWRLTGFSQLCEHLTFVTKPYYLDYTHYSWSTYHSRFLIVSALCIWMLLAAPFLWSPCSHYPSQIAGLTKIYIIFTHAEIFNIIFSSKKMFLWKKMKHFSEYCEIFYISKLPDIQLQYPICPIQCFYHYLGHFCDVAKVVIIHRKI